MGQRKKSTGTVLFLGAGASKAYGYPVTSEIFQTIVEQLKARTLFPLSSNPKRERAKMRRLRDYLERLLPAVFKEDAGLPLITEVLSLVDQFLTTGEVAMPGFATDQMEDFRTLLEQAIVEVIEGGRERPWTDKGLNRFGCWILNRQEDDGVPMTVISTNYDTLVDAFLFEKMRHTAEISDTMDMGFAWREHSAGKYLETVHHPPDMPRVRLYKLHGSLNWVRCPLCGFVYVNTVGGSIFREACRGDKTDSNNTCVCGHAPVRAVIVAPSMVRSIQDPNLLTIWRSALEALRLAQRWVFAGYSLPPEDIAIRSILVRAYHGRKRKGTPPEVRVVQYAEAEAEARDEAMEGRYRLLFPDCQFDYRGFRNFVDSLPKQRKEYPIF